MKFALDLGTGDLRRGVAAAAEQRFDGVSVAARSLQLRDLSTTGRREVAAVVRRHNLSGAALRVVLPGKGLTPEADAERMIEGFVRAATGARDCGFEIVACDLGAQPRAAEPSPSKANKPFDPAAAGLILLPTPADVAKVETKDTPAVPLTDRERQAAADAVDLLREVAARLDAIGVPFAFGASLATTADLSEILTRVGSPLFFRELDPAAVVEELQADVDAVVKTNPPILHVIGNDAQHAARRTRAADVGDGDVPWPAVKESLADAGFTGFVSVESAAARDALRST